MIHLALLELVEVLEFQAPPPHLRTLCQREDVVAVFKLQQLVQKMLMTIQRTFICSSMHGTIQELTAPAIMLLLPTHCIHISSPPFSRRAISKRVSSARTGTRTSALNTLPCGTLAATRSLHRRPPVRLKHPTRTRVLLLLPLATQGPAHPVNRGPSDPRFVRLHAVVSPSSLMLVEFTHPGGSS